jgi:hypothetical protein
LQEPNLSKTNPCVSPFILLAICFLPSLSDSFIFLTLTRLVVVLKFINFRFALFTPPLGDFQLPHVTHSKNGCRGAYKARFLPPEPFLRFSQRTCPIHYFRSKTHVWGGFAQFRCRMSPIPETGIGIHTNNEFLQPEPFLRFSQRTCPIHYFRSETHVWGGSAQFRCRTSPIPKTGVGCIQSTSFCHRNHFFVFRNEHAQSTTLGTKLMFGVVSRNFVAARHPFRKWVSGCIQSTIFSHWNHLFVFPTNMPNPLL